MSGPQVLSWPQIQQALEGIELIDAMERAFVAYSQGRCVIPPVGELQLEDPPGDVHIKYGYVRGGTHYVVKVASGFPRNHELGISSSQGLMLLFDQQSGQLSCVLLDEGRLTDARTAAAGAVAAKHLAPGNIRRIGMLGTGIQARLQLLQLRDVTPCREVTCYGRNQDAVRKYRDEMTGAGFRVDISTHPQQLLESCQLIVTTTSATEPILQPHPGLRGVHITAMGSDTPSKQELDARLVQQADLVVADSIEQCRVRGEIAQAMKADLLPKTPLVELGSIIEQASRGRSSEDDFTIADLTGVAVQDLEIAQAVFQSAIRK